MIQTHKVKDMLGNALNMHVAAFQRTEAYLLVNRLFDFRSTCHRHVFASIQSKTL
jgi:hypothetical protein